MLGLRAYCTAHKLPTNMILYLRYFELFTGFSHADCRTKAAHYGRGARPMLKRVSKLSAKRKAEPEAREPPKQPTFKPPAPKPKVFIQPTLSFGTLKPAPVPESSTEKRNRLGLFPSEEDGITWHFQDPNKRPPSKHKQQPPVPMLSPASAQLQGKRKTVRQMDKLLSLLSRGKKRVQEEAGPSRSTPDLLVPPSDTSLLQCWQQPQVRLGEEDDGFDDSPRFADAPVNDILNSLLGGGPACASVEPAPAPVPPQAPLAAMPAVVPQPNVVANRVDNVKPLSDAVTDAVTDVITDAPIANGHQDRTPASEPAPSEPAPSEPAPSEPLATGASASSRTPQQYRGAQVTRGHVHAVERDEQSGDLKLTFLPDPPEDSVRGETPSPTGAPPDVWHVLLRDEWRDTPVRPADRIHLVGDLSDCGGSSLGLPGRCVSLSRWCGALLVLRPHTQLTGTALSTACTCHRRAVLARQRKGFETSQQLNLGTMKHELFEHVLGAHLPYEFRAAARTDDELLDATVRNQRSELRMLGIAESAVRSELKQALKQMRSWAASCFPRKGAAPQSFRLAARSSAAAGDAAAKERQLQLRSVLAIEQDLCSFNLGLKGKLDATVSASLISSDGRSARVELAMPLELKTGKRSSYNISDHTAQVLVYMMLLSEHRCEPPAAGLLYYSQLSDTKDRGSVAVGADPLLLESLMMQRNMVAAGCAPHAREEGRMPQMLGDPRTCARCDELQHCFVTHAALEGGNAQSSGAEELFEAQAGHLRQAHLEYFAHWHRLLRIEERSVERDQLELFSMTAEAHEAKGMGFANMQLVGVLEAARPAANAQDDPASASSRLLHRFGRAAAFEVTSPLGATKMTAGDFVSISVMRSSQTPARWMVARGPLVEVGPRGVAVLIDANLPQLGIPASSSTEASPLLRIDKCAMATSFNTCRANLLHLLAPAVPPVEEEAEEAHQPGGAMIPAPSPAPSRLLELLVDLEPPRFVTEDEALARLPPAESERLAQLNCDQREAVVSVLRAEDYSLILGMPGTGKSTVICHAVRTLAAMGKRVLISAYTHSALDHVLVKLLEMGLPVLRLGANPQVHEQLRPHTLHTLTARIADPQLLEREIDSRLVVGVSSLALAQPLLTKATFDVCFLDEAGQITEPVCIGPLRLARRFVLVGDHYQLPPLVVEQEAEQLGFGISLFKRLAEAHPRAISQLRSQYRMAEPIMAVCNQLVYGGQLRCGSQAVAEHTLELECPEALPMARDERDDELMRAAVQWEKASEAAARGLGRKSGWLPVALAPQHKMVLLDTDAVPAPEEQHALTDALQSSRYGHGGVHNPTEARLSHLLIDTLVECGLPPSQLAFVSPYKAQLEEVRKLLRGRSLAVERLTIDKCQGRDFNVVILSLVRSNTQGRIGTLLSDWRRLNVALSRARCKMIVVGSHRTLRHSQMLSGLLELSEARGWCLELPPAAHLLYHTPLPNREEEGAVTEQGIQPSTAVAEDVSVTAASGTAASRSRNAQHVIAVRPDHPITGNILHELQQTDEIGAVIRNRPLSRDTCGSKRSDGAMDHAW